MSLVTTSGVAASTMGVLMALAPLLQLKRVRTLRDSAEVSVGLFAIWLTGAGAWLWRGLETDDLVLIVPNIVALGTNLATLVVVLRYRLGATIEDTGAPIRAERAADRPPTVRT